MSSENGGDEVLSRRRVEIDTSAPFESVKEAVSRFGGVGYWKPSSPRSLQGGGGVVVETETETDLSRVEEQARMLEKDLFAKERETLDLLKELEATKTLVGDLKSKLHKQSLQVVVTLDLDDSAADDNRSVSEEEEDGHPHHPSEGLGLFPSSAPGLILMELKQAKLNLSKTTNDLVGIRASVDSLNRKLDKESVSLEKARERLSHNCSKIASLEEELSLAKLKLDQAKGAGPSGGCDNALNITRELQRLGCEAELFKKMGEVAKSEVLKTVSEIEQTKTRIKTAEIRLVAARKMKEAARAAESMALADIKALSSHHCSSVDSLQEPSEEVTLTCEEYSTLICKAREAEEHSKTKVMEAMALVDEENVSKTEILKRVEETAEEVKISKKALDEALNRVEAANRGKLAVEEALRKWRSENGQRRRSVQNSTKFKNAYPTQHRRDSYLRDVNGLDLVNNGPTPLLKQTLSIGQILSRKLLVPEELEAGGQAGKGCLKRKVSLGQMLSKRNGDATSDRKAGKENCNKQLSGKRKKFGFARISHLLSKQNKKKKQPTPDLR